VNTFIVAPASSTAADKLRAAQVIAAIFFALKSRLRSRAYAVTDLAERLFADFARIPYHAPISRQQWEELLGTER
jgi:hypothetical protein